MKFVHSLFKSLLVVVVLALGGYATWLGYGAVTKFPVQLRHWARLGALWKDRWSPLLVGSAGLVLVLLVLVWLLSALPRRIRRRYVSFGNAEGEVSVSLEAIRDYLARLAHEFPAVVAMRPDVQARYGLLKVNMDCRVRSGVAIPPLSRDIQARVRQTIRTDLGLSEVPQVRVTVREIVGEVPPGSPRVRPLVSETTVSGDEGAQGTGTALDLYHS